MAEIKDKVITVESLAAKHDYDESTYLKKNGALGTLGITATAAELNYVDGVTSNVQTQLNNKFAKTGGTINGNTTINADLYVTDVYLTENGIGKGMIYGKTSTGSYVQNFQPCSEVNNCVIGWGNYEKKSGDTNIYAGEEVNMFGYKGINANSTLHLKVTTDVDPYADNDVALIIGNRSGSHLAMDGNEIISKASGTTAGNMFIGGSDVYLVPYNAGTDVQVKPYFSKGDSISFTEFVSGGYVTSSKTKVYFTLPLCKPIVGSPTITASSTSSGGFILRQDGNYTHGSGSSTKVTPTSYSAEYIDGIGIRVIATFSNTTNAINNDSVGIVWTGKITLS